MTGPHTYNFREIVRIFEKGNALTVVTADRLAPELLQLLGDRSRRVALGQRASELFRRHTGATLRTLEALRPFLPGETAAR
jgi:3-deoxy-D-manno-octulosonic-acid transferase